MHAQVPDQPDPPHRLHFIGICGRAVGPVATEMCRRGHRVSGSDPHPVSRAVSRLVEAGVEVCSGAPAPTRTGSPSLPEGVDLFVIGSGYGRGTPEVEAVLRSGSRYELLPRFVGRYLLGGTANTVVAGTNGKSTTTAMLAWILEKAGRSPNYLVGAEVPDLGRSARFDPGSEVAVVEGDEYFSGFGDANPKFVYYKPESVLALNLRFDHPEMFLSFGEYQRAFLYLIDLIPPQGRLILSADDPSTPVLADRCRATVLRVGLKADSDHKIERIQTTENGVRFGLMGETFSLRTFGEMNARNAAMAAVEALQQGVPVDTIRDTLATFSGLPARQEVILSDSDPGITVVRDDAYHPAALRAALAALAERFPGQRKVVLLQPRYTGGGDGYMQRKLAPALASASVVILVKPFDFPLSPGTSPFSCERVAEELRTDGCEAVVLNRAEDAAETLSRLARPDDVAMVSLGMGQEDAWKALLETAEKIQGTVPK